MDVKKILFVIPSLKEGGAEKIISILATNLNSKKYDVTVGLLDYQGTYLENIKSQVKTIDLKTKSASKSIFKIKKLIDKMQPDVVFSTLGYFNLIMAIVKLLVDKKIKFIAREASIPSERNKYLKFGFLHNMLYRILYNNFDLIIAQSNFMKNDLIKNYSIKKDLIKVINNPVDNLFIDKKKEELLNGYDENQINLLAVGRLKKVKRFDLLIKIIAKLDNRYTLTILGKGDELEYLKKLCKEYNIEHRVFFKGFESNPYKYMKSLDILVVTSAYEGFPNVVLEANLCSMPVVSFNMPGGVSEIIENGMNGFLVNNNDIDEFVNKIKNFNKFQFNKENIRNIILDKYNLRKVITEYEKYI